MLRLDSIYMYLIRNVPITTSDPAFMTQDIKTLLRRKNRLMRKGKIEEASACASRIDRAFARANNRHLRDIDPRTGMSELWRRVAVIKGRTTRIKDNMPTLTSRLMTSTPTTRRSRQILHTHAPRQKLTA